MDFSVAHVKDASQTSLKFWGLEQFLALCRVAWIPPWDRCCSTQDEAQPPDSLGGYRKNDARNQPSG